MVNYADAQRCCIGSLCSASLFLLCFALARPHMVVHVDVNGYPLDAKQRAKVNSVAQRWLLMAADRMSRLPTDALLARMDDDSHCAFYLVLIPGAAVSIINDRLLTGDSTRMTLRQFLERRGGWDDSATVTVGLATLMPFMSARIVLIAAIACARL